MCLKFLRFMAFMNKKLVQVIWLKIFYFGRECPKISKHDQNNACSGWGPGTKLQTQGWGRWVI